MRYLIGLVVIFIGLVGICLGEELLPGEKEFNLVVEKANTERDAKIKVASDAFVIRLKSEMTAKTKAGDLDGAMRIKEKINSLEPTSEKALEKDWIIIFDSDDPSQWKKESIQSKLPKHFEQLRMTRADINQFIIIKVSSDTLFEKTEIKDKELSWNGSNSFRYNAFTLGIASKVGSGKGWIEINYDDNNHYTGYGFGHKWSIGDKQGYCWDGKPINKTRFVIAVR